MPSVTIDGRRVDVPEGATLLEAARVAGITIPTLCYREGGQPLTSCMVCVVKVEGRRGLLPACATRAADGMVVESESDAVREARKTALELLLAEHTGDCEAPCQAVCPASLAIPEMIRAVRGGRLAEAAAIARRDLVLPATLGRVCPAPCEKGCRRGRADGAVSIRLLHRFAADAAEAPPPETPPHTGKSVAVVGAGPAGLAAAAGLCRAGHACTVFDEHEAAGGMLRYGGDEPLVPGEVLDAEAGAVARLGALFQFGKRVGRDVSLADLRRDYDAVVLAVGEVGQGEAHPFGMAMGKAGLQAERGTGATPTDGVFAAGSAVRPGRMAVRAIGDSKAVAVAVGEYVLGQPVSGSGRPWSVHIGAVDEVEMQAFMREATADPRTQPAGGASTGFSPDEAAREAGRCLHCDCRKPVACKLRWWAEAYKARPARYKTDERRPFEQSRAGRVVYEAGKCISCGLCVRICEQARERLGLTFVGRGFDVRVRVPFDEALEAGLERVAAECIEACPTGALAWIEGPETETA